MLSEFLKQSGLTFKEYFEWFLSLKKGDEVSRYGFLSDKIVDKVLPTGVKLDGIFGIYRVQKYTVYYQTASNNSFLAENFPIPLEKQIKEIKQKRLSDSPSLHLKVGEIYEDSEGSEWLVNNDDVPFSVAGSFTCECSNPEKGIRYYTPGGKFGSNPSPFDLVKKKEKENKKQMPNIEKEPYEVKAFDIGQVWRTAWGNEATIYRTDTLGFMSAKLDNRKLVIYDSNGKTACQNEKYELVKYLRDTDLIKIEVGKKYKTQSGKTIAIEKSDRWYFLTTEGEYYEQFSFGAEDPVVALVEEEPTKAEQSGNSIISLIKEEPMKTEPQNPQLAIGQVWEDESGKEWVVACYDEDMMKFLLCDSEGGSWINENGYETWSKKKRASKYLRETERRPLEVGKKYRKYDDSVTTITCWDKNDDTYQDSDGFWFYQFGFSYDTLESPIVEAVEECPNLAIGQIWLTQKNKNRVVIHAYDDSDESFFGFNLDTRSYHNYTKDKTHAEQDLAICLGDDARPRLKVGSTYITEENKKVKIILNQGCNRPFRGSDDRWYAEFGFHPTASIVEEVAEEPLIKEEPKLGNGWTYIVNEFGKTPIKGLSIVKSLEEQKETNMFVEEIDEVDRFSESVKNNKLELRTLREENKRLKDDLARTTYDRNEISEQLGLEMTRNQDLLKKQQELNDLIADLEDQVRATQKDLDIEREDKAALLSQKEALGIKYQEMGCSFYDAYHKNITLVKQNHSLTNQLNELQQKLNYLKMLCEPDHK